MSVVGHGYGGLSGGRDEGGGGYASGTKLIAYREMPNHIPKAGWYSDDTRSHRHPGAQLSVGLSRNLSVF